MLGRGVLSRLHCLTQQESNTLTLYVDLDQGSRANRHGGFLVQAEAMRTAELTFAELRQLILEGLAGLSPLQEQALRLNAVHRMSYASIARRLHVSIGAVTMRIKRARDRILRHVLRSIEHSAQHESPSKRSAS